MTTQTITAGVGIWHSSGFWFLRNIKGSRTTGAAGAGAGVVDIIHKSQIWRGVGFPFQSIATAGDGHSEGSYRKRRW